MITLASLFAEFPFDVLSGNPDATVIDRLESDSRRVEPGTLFVATKGANFDAHRFIPQAIARGAVAVVGSEPALSLAIPYIQVENSRLALAYLAAAFYGFPARKLTVIGVTGTDGKTTTCNLIYHILQAAGYRAGMISTVNAVIGAEVLDTGFHVTTPDAPEIQRYLAKMVQAGLTHVVLETTSHGWAQYRTDACEFDIGVITNITHEHLDEHGSYENYRAAKARLFESLALTRPKPQGNPRLGVLNAGDSSFDYLTRKILTQSVCYGLNPPADLHARAIQHDPSGTRFEAIGPDWQIPVTCNLVGAFNVSNCLAAMATTVFGLGIDPLTASRGVASLNGVPGRMERIHLGQPFTAIVDFAHTPNALANALATARQISAGRVLAAFGSAGLRDREKRRLMAEIAAERADLIVLTAEDPRSESLDEILAEMAHAVRSRGGVEGQTFWRVPDRGEAIRMLIRLAQPGDLIIACGKGHEQSMCFGTVEYPWDDRLAMRAALAEFLGVPGPVMPPLPTSRP
jgi:UDP-N-acetylmuramoyl-L-alanyl-D-glutamate--2,6-diaminopimelate ligase